MTNTITVNVKELKAAIKILNDSKLFKPNLKTVGVKSEVMVEEFVDMVETLYKDEATKEKVSKMKSVKDLYNSLVEQLDEIAIAAEKEKETGEEKAEKPKSEKKKKVAEPKAKKERDKYGFGIDTRCAMIMALAEQGKFTNKDIIKKLEGETKISPNAVFALLPGKGFIAVKNEKTGIITIKKNGK